MKLIFSTILVILIYSSPTLAKKNLSAHEHGSATISIAYDKNAAEIELESPADSVLGFEHAPKSDKEKKVFEKSKTLWGNLANELIIFSKDLNCKTSSSSFKQVIDEEDHDEKEHDEKKHDHKDEGHSEIEATATISCEKNIAGEVSIALKKHFKNMKNLKIEIMGAKPQSVKIKKEIEIIKL